MLIYLELLHYHPPGYTEQLICDSIFKLINLLLILFFFNDDYINIYFSLYCFFFIK